MQLLAPVIQDEIRALLQGKPQPSEVHPGKGPAAGPEAASSASPASPAHTHHLLPEPFIPSVVFPRD